MRLAIILLASMLLLWPIVINDPAYSVNSGPICIESDGKVSPPEAPISHTGNEYQLISDINCSSGGIVVKADNIVLNGNGYILQGYGTDTTGIDLSERENVTVRNLEVRGFYHGILMNSSDGVAVFNCTLTAYNTYALRIIASHDVMVSGNKINQFIWHGVEFSESWNCTFVVNELGNPNKISRNYALWYENSTNNRVLGNNITDNDYGIYMYNSNETTIYGNSIANNQYDLRIFYSFSNLIDHNYFTVLRYSAVGISIISSSNNTFTLNSIKDCYCGMMIEDGSNTIYCNNFINNVVSQAWASNSSNIWYVGETSMGNYWSDYTGQDTNGDGIGDTPYTINSNNIDPYPLMSPFTIPENMSIAVLALFSMATMLIFAVQKKKCR